MTCTIFKSAAVFCLISLSFSPVMSAPSAAAGISVEQVVKSALQFVEREQVRQDGPLYLKGEWPTQIRTSLVPALVGVGRLGVDEDEPSAFSTASVVNELALIYQQHPRFKQIPAIIARAQPSFQRYREGDLYNFYPPKIVNGVRVHQPAAMTLTPMWKGFTNIPQDADTTSTTWAARFYHAAFQGQSLSLPKGVTSSFARFRDLDRRAHYYNRLNGQRETGAFLTWQYDENDPAMPRMYFAEPEAGVRIPFNRNDVDCIVNLNVLRTLALTKNRDVPGRRESCELMKEIMREGQYAGCGIYYPNTFNFAYTAAAVDMAGETCLRPEIPRMLGFILSRQRGDGGWLNDGNLHFGDRVHATAFAMIALARFADFQDARIRQAMDGGARFLLKEMRRSDRGDIYWPGEVFFTDTAIARSLIVWRSDAFTTAVAASALLQAQRRLGPSGR